MDNGNKYNLAVASVIRSLGIKVKYRLLLPMMSYKIGKSEICWKDKKAIM